ncbi:hypothetical protein DSL64_27840 [Dyadobacter luteus]|uniref:HEAT repeat domain-containing protein n=1 Tax=Dyadobacter luteus TaxID=2259619 RepID=A0A3D8Y2K8_9BACT|nr:hypothetical protein [Dyadobacter luteus]REA55690.1 hypothetical protein DSL64_27840 [Dyadobacter luteus]
MRKVVLLFVNTLLSLLLAQQSMAQSTKDFLKDFEALSKARFDSVKAGHLLETYFTLLTPFNQVNQLAKRMKGEKLVQFPIAEITEQPVYRQQIEGMLESDLPQVRLLGYLMIASGGDKKRVGVLADKLKTEPNESCSLWLGMGLMSLGYTETSTLFPWVVKRNVEARGFLFPMFVSLAPDSLQQTAYQFIDSEDWNERIHAVQLLSYTKKSVRSDTMLRHAIATWPGYLKGYAIVPAQSSQIGELITLLSPLLDSVLTRRTALIALADSPTENDRQFVIRLTQEDSSDKAVMEALQRSRYTDMVKHWLLSLQSEKLPADYYVSVYRDTLVRSDALLPDVHESLKKIKNPRILSGLLPVLKGREDTASQKILIDFLHNPDHSIRETAGNTLAGTCSEELKRILPEIVSDTTLCTAPLFDLLITCGNDSLQDVAERVYRTSSDNFMATNALTYLSVFPKNKHLSLFREVLKDREGEFRTINRIAAIGLAQLMDVSSVKSIIEVSEEERKNADLNSMAYIKALGKLKSNTSKKYIASFLGSKDEQVKELASKILSSW